MSFEGVMYNVLIYANENFEKIRDICIQKNINFVIPSTEIYLCNGIVDYLQKIESTFNQDEISIIWKFEEGDDDIRKIGQDYSTILNTHIDIIEVEES